MQRAAHSNYWVIDSDPDTRTILGILLQRVIKSSSVVFFEDTVFFDRELDDLPFIPDIVFMGLVIRPLDRYAVLHKLRQDSKFQATKFISVTAKVMPLEIKEMQQAGFDGLISKPIIRQVFPELVQRILVGESVWYIA